MFYFYILKSKLNNAYYLESCNNINKRLRQHNQGLVKSTKRYMPWGLAYAEQFNDLNVAKKRELQVKHWKRRDAIENLIKHSKI